jgi:hypothetical protein
MLAQNLVPVNSINSWRRLIFHRHPNLPQLIGYSKNRETPFIVMTARKLSRDIKKSFCTHWLFLQPNSGTSQCSLLPKLWRTLFLAKPWGFVWCVIRGTMPLQIFTIVFISDQRYRGLYCRQENLQLMLKIFAQAAILHIEQQQELTSITPDFLTVCSQYLKLFVCLLTMRQAIQSIPQRRRSRGCWRSLF